MKIIIAGAGKVGSELIRQLSAEGYDLTLIDTDEKIVSSCMEQYDVIAICGNCAVRETLMEAGITEADLLIASADSDEVNLLCCVTAHFLNPELHTIARVRNPEYYSQIYEMQDQFALSMLVNPEKMAAREIERLLKFPGFLKLDTFAKGRVEIVELRIEQGSKLCDMPLTRLHEMVKCKVLVCAVLRDGEVITPRGDFTLVEGDRIFVTAPAANLAELLNNLGIITRKVRRIMLCGGGTMSIYLAELLEKSGMEVNIVEIDPEKCRALAASLPHANIICGDASRPSLLESENVMDCDALIALTGMDELNIMISLYGQTHDIPQIITKLGRVEDSKILNSLPLGSIISPKELCCNTIVRYVRAMRNQTGAANAVHFIADGKAEAIEFRVDKTSKHCGEMLKDLKLKKGMLIACISHGGVTEIPDGSSIFKAGDTVIVVTSQRNAVYSFNEIFE